MSDASTTPDGGEPPVLRVVSGKPQPEHVAALIAVFTAMGSGEAPSPQESAWAKSARASRLFPRPGPDAWRLSTRR